MTPLATHRFRRLTAAAALFWALLTLSFGAGELLRLIAAPKLPISVYTFAGNTVVQFATETAQSSGVGLGDRVLRVDGEPAENWFRNPAHEVLWQGVPNVYEVEKYDGRVVMVPLGPGPSSDGNFRAIAFDAWMIAVGLVFLGMGLWVWRARKDRTEAWAFLLFCALMAAQLFLIRASSLGWSYIAATVNPCFVAAATFHFITTFPMEPAWVLRRPGLRAAPYLLAFYLGGLVLFQDFLHVPHALLSWGIFAFTNGVCVLALVSFAIERRKVRAGGEGLVADRSDVILLAALVSYLPIAVNLFAQIFLRTAFPVALALGWLFVMPIAAAYAILRKRGLFELRQVAKSSASYGVASLSITGLFALLIYFSYSAVFGASLQKRSAWIEGAFIVFAILLFNPVRMRLQNLVDRVFDHNRARYRRAVKEISDALVSMLSIQEIVRRILSTLTDTMGVERAMVLLFDENKKALRCISAQGDWSMEALEFRIAAEHPLVDQLWNRREEFSRLDFDDDFDVNEREACRDVFDRLGVKLVIPILFGVELLGVIAVGEKVSGDRFVADDRQLLKTLANQSAIAIENAKAYDDIARLNENLEQRVEERTRELRETQAQLIQNEKMVSLGQLVAGVAHELNNPIGYVHANLQLIEDYVRKLEDPSLSDEKRAQAKDALERLVARSREGTQRVKAIVEDLRTFSRLDLAEVQEADLHECIERTISLVEHRLKAGIRIVRDYGELPRVRCFVGRINQVFMNLLVNACDALGGSGEIRIKTRALADGVVLEFSDTGPGIPKEIQNRLFEPFFTTKAVGQGTGLGLSISHSIIESHGGKISVCSTPGSGTTFRIELPLDIPHEVLQKNVVLHSRSVG